MGAEAHAASHSEAAPKANAPSSTPAANFEAELNRLQAHTVRSAHVQIAGEGNERVDVRLYERAGTLSVSVRAADADLAKSLQQHTSELTTQLASGHYKTELWTPAASRASEEQSGGAGGEAKQDPRHAFGGSENEQGKNKNKQQDPEWVTEFEKDPNANQTKVNYIWLQ